CVQDDRLDRSPISELGLERVVRSRVRGPRRRARDPMADVRHMGHRFCRRARPTSVWVGAPDVFRCGQETIDFVCVVMETSIMKVPDKAIPRDLLARAKAIAVFPRVIKVAFTVGGEGGRGVVSQHTSTGWANPVFLRAGGGSVGPQIGASSTDFFLLLMNDES